MSTIRPVKKKKEEQDYTLTNSGGLTFEEYQSMKNSGDEEKTQNQQNQYTTWRDQSKELLNEYQNYASSGDYQTQEAHDDYFSRLQKQLGKAVSMRKNTAGRTWRKSKIWCRICPMPWMEIFAGAIIIPSGKINWSMKITGRPCRNRKNPRRK